jgi:large subunit ribosomal protein L10
MSAKISQEKREAVQETIELLNKYEVIAAADLYKVSSRMLQDMRNMLRDQLTFKVVKNTLMTISLEEAGKEKNKEFMEQIPGPNVFLFTNGNPFKVAMELEQNKVKVFAKPGDIAMKNIVIQEGNTGLSPGPMIGKFGALGVRTRIEAGNIWVVQDTTVARKGEEINEDLADLLQRMGMREAEMGLKIKAVYEKGDIIPGDILLPDIEEYKKQVEQALSQAFQVAVQAAYVTPQTLSTILSKAIQQAKAVAMESAWTTKDTVQLLIAKANGQARSLAKKVGETQAKTK